MILFTSLALNEDGFPCLFRWNCLWEQHLCLFLTNCQAPFFFTSPYNCAYKPCCGSKICCHRKEPVRSYDYISVWALSRDPKIIILSCAWRGSNNLEYLYTVLYPGAFLRSCQLEAQSWFHGWLLRMCFAKLLCTSRAHLKKLMQATPPG